MILEMTPLSMIETKELLEDIDKEHALISHINKFTKLKPDEARKIREDLNKLNLMKIKTDHIIKIIDTMPEDVSDLNKIFTDVSLDEDENKKVLEIIKEYK